MNEMNQEKKTIIGETTFTLKSGQNAPAPNNILERHNAMREQSRQESHSKSNKKQDDGEKK